MHDALKKGDATAYANFVRARAEEEGARRAEEQHARERALGNGDDSADMRRIKAAAPLKAPCCGMVTTDFTDCCKVQCACGQSFCAWCFQVFTPLDDGHLHVQAHCPVNPDNGLYANTPKKRALLAACWRARQLQQLAEANALDVTMAHPQQGQPLPIY